MTTQMTYQEWLEKYKPVMDYDTPKDYVDFPADVDPHCIWTVLDDGGGWEGLYSGFHWCNRLAHYLATVPFVEGDHIYIELDCPRCYECDEELREEGSVYGEDWVGNIYCEECHNKLPNDKKADPLEPV